MENKDTNVFAFPFASFIKLAKKDIFPTRFQKLIESLIISSLCLLVYLFTVSQLTRPYALTALVVCGVFISGLYVYHLNFGKKHAISESRTLQIIIFTLITAVLLWVGNTGWFLSPFFYLLYLVGISLAFLFSTSVAFSFVLVLIAILLPNISATNPNVDIATLASLLLIIPLSYFLRREYLSRIEKEKKILVLEQEHKEFKNKVDEILANKITRVGADLREPINDVRQIALVALKHRGSPHTNEFKKIVESSEKALNYLKTFEENTTGREFLSTPDRKKN